ncbi:MAG: vWA domain-containing protein [Archangium sp.]
MVGWRWFLLTSFVSSLVGCGRTDLVRYSPERPDASIDAGSGVDAGRDAGVDAGIDAGCPDRPVPMTPAVPMVMFVIDRSGSMLEDLDGNVDAGQLTRWEVLDRSLSAVLPPLDRRIATGLVMFPHDSISCGFSTTVEISPAVGNVAAVQSRMRLSNVAGGTPTADAIDVATQHLLGLTTATSARALVLATDGAPNCNTALDVSTCTCTTPPVSFPNCDDVGQCLDDLRTISSINLAFQDTQIPTYVIGLGSGLNPFRSTLDRMAIAGGVPRPGIGDRYYSASSQTELDDAFTRITAQLTRCTYLVTGVGRDEVLTVRVDGRDVPEGPTGWEWLDRPRGELVLHGLTCDRVAMGSDAEAFIACP